MQFDLQKRERAVERVRDEGDKPVNCTGRMTTMCVVLHCKSFGGVRNGVLVAC